MNVITGERREVGHYVGGMPFTDPEEVTVLLADGIRERMVSDRPLCFLLSGGLDSTLVLALVRELALHPDPVAYTAVLDPDSPDLAAARRVAAHYDVPLHEVKVPPVTEDRMRQAVWTVEVPMKAQVEIALANLPLAHAIASDGFRVCLSGEAADELFGGYGGMAIKAASTDDRGWRSIREEQVAKMARGNFMRVNKVFMAAGVESRLPFMQTNLVEKVLATGKTVCPPGKGLLKEAARGLVPDWVIGRPKETFQGAVGTKDAAAAVLTENPTTVYNQMAREAFGYLPRG